MLAVAASGAAPAAGAAVTAVAVAAGDSVVLAASAGPASAGVVSAAAELPPALDFLSFCGMATSVRKMPQMLERKGIRCIAYLLEDALDLGLQVVEVETC